MGALRVGVIGFGNRVSGLVRQLAERAPDLRVAAVADPKGGELKAKHAALLADASFFTDADALLRVGGLDGVLIGTRCSLHAPLAAKVAPTGLPLFLEKPVATSYEQLRTLGAAWAGVASPVVVSFPLRVSPLCRRVKRAIDEGAIGRVEHVVAFNDVPYGDVYFGGWYRDWNETGGLFLQKATHDFDYISSLVDSSPKRIAAMTSRRVWGGTHPFDLKCEACGECETCTESPFSPGTFLTPDSAKAWGPWRQCLYAEGMKNEDSGNALIEYANGVQVSYTQNFFARHHAARRGARLYGYRGTIEFDWYANRATIHRHDKPATEILDLPAGAEHFGGDAELVANFLAVMRGEAPSATPLAAGLESALACLTAREAAARAQVLEVRLP